MADKAAVVEHHQLAVLLGVGLPRRQTLDVGVARVCKLCPRAAHQVGQVQIVGRGLGYDVACLVQPVEAEAELVAMNRTQTDG